jgi:hypothetical protein
MNSEITRKLDIIKKLGAKPMFLHACEKSILVDDAWSFCEYVENYFNGKAHVTFENSCIRITTESGIVCEERKWTINEERKPSICETGIQSDFSMIYTGGVRCIVYASMYLFENVSTREHLMQVEKEMFDYLNH